MSYMRVIPRDLFNEAKLLKSLGQLSLLIEDGASAKPLCLALMHSADDYAGFDIQQDPASGNLYVANLTLYAAETVIHVESVYNSKLPYPLVWEGLEGPEYVLNDDGSLAAAFVAYWGRKEQL